jgi:hypothetical protein
MAEIVIDDLYAQKLSASHGPVQLLDRRGRIVGYFLSCASENSEEHERAAAQWSDAELDRRASEPGGKSTAEILEKLSKL